MGAFDFWWNITQSSEIDDIREECADHLRRIDVLEQWIVYLNNELEKVKNERIGSDVRADESSKPNSTLSSGTSE